MADNFNLRAFLSENSLTKSAKLLKEYEESQGKQEVYYDDVLYHIHARYPDKEAAIQGVAEYLEDRNGPVTFDQWEEAEVPYLNFDGPCYHLMGPDEKPGQHSPLIVSVKDEDLITDPELVAQYKADDQQQGGEGNLDEGSDYGFDALMDAADDLYPEGTPENGKLVFAIEKALHSNSIDTSEFGDDLGAAARAVEAIANEIGLNEIANKMTARERRLVEMVQTALGLEGYGDDNVERKLEKRGEAPAQRPTYSEGDQSVEESKPLPKYNSIEELMKEIEHGTNEAAHKYKMEEMKRVYEALEAKVTTLEEGENAEHIDQKKVKQMRKDITALRKAEEKLRKEFDKKFSDKEKKEAPKKEKEDVTLAEGNFNLRKFLAENRK